MIVYIHDNQKARNFGEAQEGAAKQYMVASNVVTRSNFICIHTYYIYFIQYLTEQSEKVLSLTVNTSAILSQGSFLLSFKYTWFPTMINKPTVGYILLLLLSSFLPFCFIFFNSSFLSSKMFSNVSYDLSFSNTHPYFVALLLSLRVPIHSTPLFVIYFVRL